MIEQKTLLEQIREKEYELNKRLELAARDAEGIVSDARRRADNIISEAEVKGGELADEHYRSGKAVIDREVEDIKGRERKKTVALRDHGEKNLAAAADLIIGAVTFH